MEQNDSNQFAPFAIKPSFFRARRLYFVKKLDLPRENPSIL